MTSGSTQDSLDTPDSRTHPASPLVKAGRVVVAIIGVAVLNVRGAEHAESWLPLVGLVLATIAAVFAYISWSFTTFRIADGDVRVSSGVLVKRVRRVRIDRLQAIDVVQPLFARMLGLAELKLDMAGGSQGKVAIEYLKLEQAQSLRASLLAMAAGLDHRTPEAPERPLVRCSTQSVVGGALLSTAALVALCWVAGVLVIAFVSGSFGIVGAVLPGVLGVVAPVWHTVQSHANFVVAESPDGLRLRHGLLETRSQTVPPGRVQAVQIVQPLMWRALHWVRVEANIAGYAARSANEGQHHNSTLLPVGSREQAAVILERVLPGVDLASVELLRVPGRAKWRSPFRWWTFRAGANDQVFVVRSGVLSNVHAVMRHEKVQSVALSVGPLQRLLRLATVHVHSTHGPVNLIAPDRDIIEARTIVDAEAVLARTRRAQAGPEQWMSPRS